MADAVLLIRRRRRRMIRLNRYWSLKDVSDPFRMRSKAFVRRFRLSKQTAWNLCGELKVVLLRRNLLHLNGYPLELQVLNTLRILGSGSFQTVAADGVLAEIDQSTVSRHMKRILDCIIDLRRTHITFPVGNDIPLATAAFYDDLSFPNTIGAIDCTHVRIERPPNNEWFVYLNRHAHFTINVQMVANSKMKFLDVVARWPGSSHDSFIWKMSNLRTIFAGNTIPSRTFLLGDSGYPLEPWLMIPYAPSNVAREQVYNKKHKKARNVVERAFGLLKNRFRCLHSSGGILMYTPAKVCRIIMACAVLHNMCITQNDHWDDDSPDPKDVSEEEDDIDRSWGTDGTSLHDLGSMYRDELAIHFSRTGH
ncbi:putative nuclease HARBI1 [Uloborus diversus]|uniref:putative nuclease HARBI1 n=1 Tax=Uloborus diversus TaxID=327109 RepID=UPI002409CCD7|nr:putative nuclease HARBI1 [Uloborus diversus]